MALVLLLLAADVDCSHGVVLLLAAPVALVHPSHGSPSLFPRCVMCQLVCSFLNLQIKDNFIYLLYILHLNVVDLFI